MKSERGVIGSLVPENIPSTEKILLPYCSKMTFKVMSDKRQKLWLNNG